MKKSEFTKIFTIDDFKKSVNGSGYNWGDSTLDIISMREEDNVCYFKYHYYGSYELFTMSDNFSTEDYDEDIIDDAAEQEFNLYFDSVIDLSVDKFTLINANGYDGIALDIANTKSFSITSLDTYIAREFGDKDSIEFRTEYKNTPPFVEDTLDILSDWTSDFQEQEGFAFTIFGESIWHFSDTTDKMLKSMLGDRYTNKFED